MSTFWGEPLFDSYENDYDEGYDFDSSEVTCRYCGERHLHWEEGRGDRNRKKFVLVDEEGKIHDCRSMTGSANEFDDLDNPTGESNEKESSQKKESVRPKEDARKRYRKAKL